MAVPPLSTPGATISVDIDDVLGQTNAMLIAMHNQKFGTTLTLNDMQSVIFSQNKGWGNVHEARMKLLMAFEEGYYAHIDPVPGALEALRELKGMGYRLIALSSRNRICLDISNVWMDKHFPGIFDQIIFLGSITPDQVQQVKSGANIKLDTGPPKPRVLHTLNASLHIDDAVHHALACAAASPPIPTLLFGNYPWNRDLATGSPDDQARALERLEKGQMREADEVGMELPEGITRVKAWEGVVAWVREQRGVSTAVSSV